MPGKAVYAPGHHNFSFEYAWDMHAVDQLSREEAAILQSRGISRLLLRLVSPNANLWDEPGLEATEAARNEPVYELIAVDAEGRETILDRLKQTAKSDFMNSDSAFGIGIFR
jgi:hypothetical protein